MTAKFEIYKDKGGEFRFRLKAANGETILSSEGYKAAASARAGAESVKKNADLLARFEKKSSAGGKPYFTLKAANGEVIGTSEMYADEAARDDGIKSVMRAAPLAAIEEKA
jgi:hypothetical protein